jgi:hypothetical protein
VSQRALELTYTAWDLESFARDCGYDCPPFQWNGGRRFVLRCELHAALFHLYGVARDDVDYILDAFPIVRREDEQAHGDYRTKRVILEMYDDMARAMAGAPLPDAPGTTSSRPTRGSRVAEAGTEWWAQRRLPAMTEW